MKKSKQRTIGKQPVAARVEQRCVGQDGTVYWTVARYEHGVYTTLVEAAYAVEKSFDATYGAKPMPKAVQRYLNKHKLTAIPTDAATSIYHQSWRLRGYGGKLPENKV